MTRRQLEADLQRELAQEAIAHLGQQSKVAKDESVAAVRRLISELQQGYARIQRDVWSTERS